MRVRILTYAQSLIAAAMAMVLLSACTPSEAPRDVQAIAQSTGGTIGSTPQGEILYAFEGETRNFFYSGSSRIFDNLTWTAGINDSFLLWGSEVQTQILNTPETTKVCLLFEYKNTTPSRVLALSGVRRRQIVAQTSSSVTVSYYWLVYPEDSQRNQSDCQTTAITNIKNQFAGTSSPLRFSLSEVCSDCAVAPLSQSVKAYTNTGTLLTPLNLTMLRLRIQPNTSGAGNGQSCSSNSACAAIGFNCCLDGQCVNDRAIKNGVDQTLPAFLSALNDVTSNPQRYINYPQFFYVCPNVVNPAPTGGGDTTNPDFQALSTLNKKKDLFTCLNPQFDEISYCAIRVSKASQLITSSIPANKLFTVTKDDNNFRWSGNNGLNANTISAIRYGEISLYEETSSNATLSNPAVSGSHALQGSGNEDLLNAQVAQVTKILPANAGDDTLVITYKVDGTCEKLNSSLARCRKSYVQGQASTPPRPTDHAIGQSFRLPSYASIDDSFPPVVKVNDTFINSEPGVTWTYNKPARSIDFTSTIFPNQKVDITYYVDAGIAELTAARTAAQAQVNSMCGCGSDGSTTCNLVTKTQVTNGVSSIVDYVCQPTPIPEPEAPLFQQLSLSSRSVPVRYYDSSGIVWDGSSSDGAPTQEGIEFNYTNNDPQKPNNLASYIGFHEIYGSYNKKANAPRPPERIAVKKGQVYDIFVENGNFSSCVNCGNDPYQQTLKLFPQTFSRPGGGYTPDRLNTSRRNSSGIFRADDLLFGRACFVPATMIPWTHSTGTTAQQQRQRRMAAQHFMFANGYNRDWFGFDYGSVIGSFDGVTWFAIGSQRRITATSNKLFLAVNGYFGDLTLSDAFKVTVLGDALSAGSGSNITHDTQSSGAECQQSHYCSTDDDCIRQLGYDYSCQNVSSIQTPWPEFDVAGNESIGSRNISLVSLLRGSNGQPRRCVYRGRGAPCEPDLSSLSATFNGSDTVGLSACSVNNHCAAVATSSRFNSAIARFASSPASQNSFAGLGVKDVFGQGARFIGRPLDFYGTKPASSVTSSAWSLSSGTTLRDYLRNSVNVEGMCLPGRDLTNTTVTTTYNDLHARAPSSSDRESADRIFGVGATAKLSTSDPVEENSLALCPTTSSGTYVHLDPGLALSSSNVSIAQNLSTNIYNHSVFNSLSIFNTTSGSAALTLGYQRNACLRAAGAACFSDLECAPSDFVASKMKGLSNWGNLANNKAEQAFLKEELICGNPEPTKLFSGVNNTLYDIKQNKCCRQLGKTASVYTQLDQQTDFLNCAGLKPAIAGVNINFDDPARNSRNHTIYDKATCVNPAAPTEQPFPALVAATQRCTSTINPSDCNTAAPLDVNYILNQYKTLDLMNSRTCCTGHWVRSFAPENGGGHKWGAGKSQTIDKQIFYAWNWYFDQKFTATLDEANPLECSSANFGTLGCEMRSFSDEQSNTYLKWIDRFELVGIPQVLIPFPSASTEKLVDTAQASLETLRVPLDDTLNPEVVTENKPDVVSTTTSYVSAASYDKIAVDSGKMRKVFSENEFNCCVPAGGSVPQGADAGSCCTGTLTDQNGALRCCLGDFADVTVYLNRYVSSEGRGLEDARYDKETGYLKNPSDVLAIAQARNLCCSGKIVTGRAISNLFIPLENGTANPQGRTRRFTYRNDAVDNNTETGAIGDIYDAGLRWNNHYYCAPAGYVEPTGN